jgi:diadenosine tetraphosphate (Ap4A) HIT family hydrolase
MNSRVFCDIVSGKRPAELLHENEHAIGILDIRPIHYYGHSLIIPN